ncbi:MAG: ATPase [Rhodothermaceae bacterium]|nr:MAG: ATPase [Rhodothermaceae bacterium]
MFPSDDPLPDRLVVVMASEHLQLERVVSLAEEFARAHEPDEDFVYRVVLLTSEAFTNAIEHGNRLDPEKKVTVEFCAAPDRIEVWVEDQGPGFDREAVADPLKQENLLENSGRGLFLIEQMADDVIFEKDGRRVGMIFHRPAR